MSKTPDFPITRRQMIGAALTAAMASQSKLSHAAACFSAGHLGQRCTSEVSLETFSIHDPSNSQHFSMWCWAASISMIFRHHGYNVTQEQIVLAEYNALVNLPAGTGWRMTKQLDRNWTDGNGKKFNAKLKGLFDLEYNIHNLNNNDVVAALDANQPLLVGTMGHAVVQTKMEYFKNNGAVANHGMAVTVFDPWPGKGMRVLAQQEMTPNPFQVFQGLHYIARAEITPL